MTTTTRPTANGVSRTLGKQAKRSTESATRVRGYRTKTRGYKVSWNERTGDVIVEYVHGSSMFADKQSHEERETTRDEELAKYKQILSDAGYVVEYGFKYADRALVVTGRVA